ncbi:MAG: prepilin-type N-terminal cleavage/methylation domain-containing protein [Erysipelotrichaceae bacterium]|nr:prepilin-type N-terminal cleavage/methylation domain-containing protein [Erysipelotrichaceae bacterium]
MVEKKLNRKGFSLAELLLAIAILLLATGIVAAGIPAAISAYRKVVDAANAQVLLTTATTCLRDELDMSPEVQIAGDVITYVDEHGWQCIMKNGSSLKGILVSRSSNNKTEDQLLVSDSAASKKFYIVYESVSKSGNVVTFTNLQVKKKDDDSAVSDVKLDRYSVHIIKQGY